MKQSEEIENWKAECESFSSWFQKLGGNIGSDEQMSEAFKRIEAKSVSDNRLYEMLDEQEEVLKMPEYENWVKSFENITVKPK
jgi:hypothetical protein